MLRPPLLVAAAAACLLASPLPARAQQLPEAQSCTGSAALPPALSSWRMPVAARSVGTVAKLSRAELKVGQAVRLALLPTPKVAYILRPEKPGGSVSYGGLDRFVVEQAGTWRVALGSGAWVDVVKDGKAMPSVAHGHGPQCSGVRKMVDYDLSPGTYGLQIAANGSGSIGLLVTRLR